MGKKVARTATGCAICPEALRGMFAKTIKSVNGNLIVERQQAHSKVIEAGWKVTRLYLVRDNIRYDAYFVTNGEKISSQWMIHALDGHRSVGWPMADDTEDYQAHSIYLLRDKMALDHGYLPLKDIIRRDFFFDTFACMNQSRVRFAKRIG